MADSPTKGAFQADIPADAVEEALRSFERVHATEAPASAAEGTELAVEPAADEAGAESEREKSLAAQLELSQEKARETMERLKDTHDRYLRAVAELENYRKRAQKERDDVLRFGNEKLLKDIFPIMDALDRALAAAAPAEEAGSARRRGEAEGRAIDDPLVKGVQLVRAGLEQALARHGVSSFSALGQPFDPSKHEALMQVATAEQPPGTVVLEHARGFLLNDRLARPAMVGVAKAPEPAAEGAEGGTEEAGSARPRGEAEGRATKARGDGGEEG
jgi:molecular chaperone GrpE